MNCEMKHWINWDIVCEVSVALNFADTIMESLGSWFDSNEHHVIHNILYGKNVKYTNLT